MTTVENKSFAPRLLRGTAVTSSLTIVSRFLGFLRDLIVARTFGSGFYADAFFVAFRIPNLLRSFVAEGAMSAAFVPIFSADLLKGKEHAQRTLSAVSGFLLLLTITLSVLGIIFSETLVAVLAPGFSLEQRELCTLLSQIMFPYIISVSVVALLNGALNSVGIFGVSAWAQSVMNIVLILGGVVATFVSPNSGIVILAVSVLLGGITQVLFQFPALRRSGFTIKPTLQKSTPIIKAVLKLMIPAVLGATVYQISIFVSTLLASLLQAGSISWLFYADRLVQLPVGVFTVALASVLLPALSRAASAQEHTSFETSLLNSLRYTSFVIMPLATLLAVCAEPIVQFLFERGAFTHESTINTADAVQAMAVGIWAMSCHSMLSRAFLARKDTVTPTLIGLSTLVVSATTSLTLMGSPLSAPESSFATVISTIQTKIGAVLPLQTFGHVGLAMASSIGAFFAFFALFLILKRRVKELNWSIFWIATAKSFTACVALAASAWCLEGVSSSLFLELSIRGLAGAGAFVLCSYLLRSRELTECLEVVRSRLRL